MNILYMWNRSTDRVEREYLDFGGRSFKFGFGVSDWKIKFNCDGFASDAERFVRADVM